MRRAVLSWIAIGVVFVGALALSIAALNADVYSARGFVRSYLDALTRRDAAAALAMPGVQPASGARDLLTPPALGGLGAVTLVSDTADADGNHVLVFDVGLPGEEGVVDSGSGTARTEFHVQPLPARFGIFASWRFATSPLATLDISVDGADSLTINAQQLDLAATSTDYLVFAPGLYRLDHESTWLEAVDVPVRVAEPGTVTDAELEAIANDAFIEAVSSDLADSLDACAGQGVLMPSGCPFGRTVTDRVVGDVQWTIDEYPVVTIAAGEHPGEWTATAAQGRAALSVPVQSLYTGDESTLEATTSISAEYDILIGPTGSFTIGSAD